MPYPDGLLYFDEWLEVCCDYDTNETSIDKLEAGYEDYCINFFERQWPFEY
jgi:hypothetical protein